MQDRSCTAELSVREGDFSLGVAEGHSLALICQIIKPTSVYSSAYEENTEGLWLGGFRAVR